MAVWVLPSDKRQRTRTGRGAHDRIQTNGRGPDAGRAVPPNSTAVERSDPRSSQRCWSMSSPPICNTNQSAPAKPRRWGHPPIFVALKIVANDILFPEATKVVANDTLISRVTPPCIPKVLPPLGRHWTATNTGRPAPAKSRSWGLRGSTEVRRRRPGSKGPGSAAARVRAREVRVRGGVTRGEQDKPAPRPRHPSQKMSMANVLRPLARRRQPVLLTPPALRLQRARCAARGQSCPSQQARTTQTPDMVRWPC
eukprot:gene11693-biopygen9437